MRLLFWNCMHNIKCADIVTLLKSEDIDIAFFAESSVGQEAELLEELTGYVSGNVLMGCKKITYIHKDVIESIAVREQGRYMITRIIHNTCSFLIGAVHMRDKINSMDSERAHDCCMLAEDMREAEDEYQINDSLIIGDFNCNPWETPMTLKFGLNAVMYKEVIKNHNGKCSYGEREISYYYNPMLSIVSEEEGKLGSIYNTTDVNTIYWNIFDQVIVRPSLMERLSRVELLKKYSGICLVSAGGIPNKRKYSDHLPLLVEVEE